MYSLELYTMHVCEAYKVMCFQMFWKLLFVPVNIEV